MNASIHDDILWDDFRAAELAFHESRRAFFKKVQNLTRIIGNALKDPSQRGTALRILEILPEEESRLHLQNLVTLASVAHSDIGLCRDVIMRIDKNWLISNIQPYVDNVLQRAEEEEQEKEEEYKRIAELYEIIDNDLLARHLKRCSNHSNPEINEIALDYSRDTEPDE